MPAQPPATFASAAASNGAGDGLSGRNAAGSGDWSRPRMNGSQTFRRPSQLNTAVSGQTRDSSAVQTPSSSGVYVPPHMNTTFARNAPDIRYSKDQLLDLWKSRPDVVSKDLASLLTEGWAPTQSAAGGNSWGRRDERDPNPGPEICWDGDGATKPLAFIHLSAEEKELRESSVNSLVKPPQQVPKDGQQAQTLNGRKSSISQGTGSLSGRPGARRRDTTESFSGNPLASPTFQRNENPLASPPPSLMRRRTDLRDAFGEVDKIDTNVDAKSPFGSLRRTTTNPLSAGLNGPASPWAAEPPSAGGFARMGSFGVLDQPGTPGDKKTGFGSLGSSSRFLKDFRGKEPGEEATKNRSSFGILDRLADVAEERNLSTQKPRLGHRAEPSRLDGDPEPQAGSAALGGEGSSNIHGSNLPPFRERPQQQHDLESTQHSLTHNAQERMSPTHTNPYHSPEHERQSMDRPLEEDQESTDNTSQGFSQARRNNLEHSEHGSRPGSTAPPRGMAGLGGFGGPNAGFGSLGGWPGQNPMAQAQTGRSPFAGEAIFGSLGSLGTPGAGGVFSPSGSVGPAGFGGPQRSKLGSLFPAQMQDQMRTQDNRQDILGSIGPSDLPPRDTTESPAARSSRNIVDDLFSAQPGNRGPAAVSSPFGAFENPFGQSSSQVQGQPGFSAAVGTPGIPAHSQQQSAGSALGRTPDNDSNQLPASQQRTMVMPDRMRWIYRDPQGVTQGPWSGLEMHDWYKAGFFSPELQVKKQEDADYEPLAQLIRRIGNSREPFLVPQIGIPHGSSVGGPGAGVSGTAGAPAGGNIQPPFASSFPSFGTTLTAEQQNALERRKQEEQYLMAQQKEYLQHRQQALRTQPGFPAGPSSVHQGQLQHHSSAQSLQSQPSFGSIGGGTFQSGAGQASNMAGNDPFGVQRSHTGSFGPVGPTQAGAPQSREDELASSLDRVNLARASQSPFAGLGGPGMQQGIGQQDPNVVGQILQDRGRLQQEQLEAMQRAHRQPQDPSEGLGRFAQFQQLRETDATSAGVIGKPSRHVPQSSEDEYMRRSMEDDERHREGEPYEEFEESEKMSFEEPTRPEMISMASKDVSDVNTAGLEDVPPAQSVWAPIEKPTAHPIDAPAPSMSPLPAPAAQRANRYVAETLAADNRSRSQTPSVETPSSSLAPWAKETVESAPRGPSLKEIQELEARQAAERETIMAQRRREAAEQERLAQAAMPEPTPGLPSSASWAASGTPASPGASAWAKPTVGANVATIPQKKTLAQIQKEEEARKNRAAAVATAAAVSSLSSPVAGGKRYAELASKTAQPAPGQIPGVVGGAWTTVGASGKVKTPGGAVPTRTASGSITTLAPTPAVAKKPPQPVRTSTMQTASAQANEEVSKWARLAIARGLNSGINADEFIKVLMTLPLDVELVSDSIYSSSNSLDGRRLAGEFIRRRKLADRGIVEPAQTVAGAGVGSSNVNNGGWSEVAKTKPVPKEEPSADYKVVQKKKQGKR